MNHKNSFTQPTGQVIIISGMSGAGKSVALKTFEDLGFETIDNIPLSMLSLVIEQNPQHINLAIGIDIRNRDFSDEAFFSTLNSLKTYPNLKVSLLFIDCNDEELRKRFSSNRRRHPIKEDHLVTDGIKHERELLISLKTEADIVIDTTNFSSLDLTKYIRSNFHKHALDQVLSIVITSFSFRHGLIQEADLVFDVRFIKNPFYDINLRDLNGTDPKVGKFIEEDQNFVIFMQHLTNLLTHLIPLYLHEGKTYLTIAIGCTGGKHRSVYTAKALKKILKNHGYKATVIHKALSS